MLKKRETGMVKKLSGQEALLAVSVVLSKYKERAAALSECLKDAVDVVASIFENSIFIELYDKCEMLFADFVFCLDKEDVTEIVGKK